MNGIDNMHYQYDKDKFIMTQNHEPILSIAIEFNRVMVGIHFKEEGKISWCQSSPNLLLNLKEWLNELV